MGYEYSIRNALYTFSDVCASCLMLLQQILFFSCVLQPIRLFPQEPN
jgi:hypothetical protein